MTGWDAQQHRSVALVVLGLCQSIDGVVDVIDRLRFEQDDMATGTPSAAEQ
ncbi:hypothetical protein ABZ667_28150 [Streptomyces lavendulae]|uniref:hypothetical protein n=1 Tax=Streptomyces lavendulae TaxID=1914 RepID=UPI0033CAB491